MTLGRLTSRERRLLAIGLLVIAAALLIRLVLVPILGGFQARAEARERLQMTSVRNERLIASVPRLTRVALKQRTELRLFLLTAPSPEKGVEILEERLRTSLDAVGGELVEMAPLEAPADELRLRVDARLTEPQLQRLLVELQNRPPYLVVETLAVTAEDALLTGEDGALAVRLDLSVPFVATAA